MNIIIQGEKNIFHHALLSFSLIPSAVDVFLECKYFGVSSH